MTVGRSTSGLRRFARPAPAPDAGSLDPSALPRIGQRTRDDGVERCEMCAEALPPEHGHVVELDKRSIACACRGCYLLFTAEGAGRGRYRAIPRRIHHDPRAPLTSVEFDSLRVPVAMAFFFRNSMLDRIVGSYPSPGGATECELDLNAWDELAVDHPLLAALTPDVEALLVDRIDGRVDAFIIPIDACYALVGRIRMLWSGFDGGQEVRDAIAAFRDDLRARSTPLPVEA